MEISEYQIKSQETAVYPGKKTLAGLVYTILGLTGEAGELANKVKKVLRNGETELTLEKRDELIDELGDVLWYVAGVAEELNIYLGPVAEENLAKLAKRKAEGTLKNRSDAPVERKKGYTVDPVIYPPRYDTVAIRPKKDLEDQCIAIPGVCIK